MRYYLDTNILVFLFTKQSKENIRHYVYDVITDYANMMLTSSVCVHELIHLCQIGKLQDKKRQINAYEILNWLHAMGIEIVPVAEKHLDTLANLTLFKQHRDPFDRLIIAQAISDKISLISSDSSFLLYEKLGLKILYNNR